MSQYLTALLTLALVPGGHAGGAAGPPAQLPSCGPAPRVVEEPFSCAGLSPLSEPERRPSLTYHRLQVRVPCLRTVIVEEVRPERVVRKVVREVPVQKLCTELVYVPYTNREVRMVLREETHRVLDLRPAIVQEVRRGHVIRKVIREVPVQKLCTREVYVPVTTHEPRPRTVYAEEPVRMTRAACVVRLEKREVTDPVTGKSHTVEEPVCETRQVTETVKRYVLRNEVATVPVTRYHLTVQTRPETVKEYVPTWEEAVVNVTRYRKEWRPETRCVKTYHLEPREVTEKHYRLEPRTALRTVKEYVPTWEEAVVNVTRYRVEQRVDVRPVDVYVHCEAEQVAQVPRLAPVLWTGVRRGVAAFAEGPFAGACGAAADAPGLGGNDVIARPPGW